MSPEPGWFGLGHRDAEEATRLQSPFLLLQMKDLVDGDLPAQQHAQGVLLPSSDLAAHAQNSATPHQTQLGQSWPSR